MKKDAPLKHQEAKKTSDEKRGTPKTPRGSKRPLMKKETPLKCQWAKKTSDEKDVPLKHQGDDKTFNEKKNLFKTYTLTEPKIKQDYRVTEDTLPVN
jgi:hypothetical protein